MLSVTTVLAGDESSNYTQLTQKLWKTVRTVACGQQIRAAERKEKCNCKCCIFVICSWPHAMTRHWHSYDTTHYTIDQAWHSSHIIERWKSHDGCMMLNLKSSMETHPARPRSSSQPPCSRTPPACWPASPWSCPWRAWLSSPRLSPCHECVLSSLCPAPNVCRPGRSDRIWTLVLTRLRLLGTCYSGQQLLSRAGRDDKWADSLAKVRTR